MKKFLLFLLTLMIGFGTLQLSAQQTVEIGDGTGTTYYGPFNSLWGYSFVEQIYTAEEIDMAGNITSISFNKSSGTGQTNNIVVYMKNVNRSSFSSSTDYEPVTAADIVYEGSWAIPTTGWTTITLDNPFDYDGVSNLMIAIHEYTSGYTTQYFYYTSVTNSVISFHSDSYNPDPYNLGTYSGSKYTQSNRPNIRMEIMPSGSNCYGPISPAVSEITAYEATLSWTPRDGQTSWEVCCVSGEFDPDQANWTSVTDTFFTFTGLTPATGYTAYVRTNCGDEVSNPRQVNFTTIATCASVPSNVTVSNITATSVDVNWTAGDDDSAWEVVVVPSGSAPETGDPESATEHPYTVTDLQDNTSYKVYVRTDCGDGDHSYWSTAASFTTYPFCSSPLHVTISQIRGTSAMVSWDEALFGADNYTVEYSEANQENWIQEIVDGTQFMISDLDPNTSYDVMVYSNCEIGDADTVFKSFTTNCLAGGNLTIGNGTSTSYYIPVNNYYNYTYSQQIFLSSELNGAGEIRSVSFQYNYSSPSTDKNDVTIYLGHTNRSSFSSSSEYIPMANLQQVYTGNLNCSQGWNTFTFTTPFQYNGIDNLVLAVDDNSGDYNGQSYVFNVHNAGNNKSVYFYSDTYNPDPSNPNNGGNTSVSSNRNNVIFGSECDEDAICIAPNVYITANSESSITLDWAPGYTEGSWDIEYSEDDSTWVPVGNITSHPYELDNLAADTKYSIHIRSNCGSEQSDWVTISTRTACSDIDIPYAENFEDAPGSGSGNMITCWTRNTNSSTAYPYTSNSQKHSGNYSVYFYGTSSIYSYLVTPRFDDNVQMDNLQIRFFAYKASANYYIQVGIMTDPDDISTFEQIGQNITPDTTSKWQLMEVNTDDYVGDGQYIAFRVPIDITNYFYIDDIEIDNIPVCSHVTDIHTSNITANGATIEWTPGDAEGSWQVVYGEAGTITSPNMEISSTVQAPSISLSDLNSNTVYDIYVKALCSTDESSIWIQYSFRTECSTITSIPFIEDFETLSTGSNSPIYCWTRSNTYSSSTNYPYVSTTAHSGSKALYFYSGNGNYNLIATPALDQTIDINTLSVSFWMRSSSYSYTNMIVGVMTDPEDVTTFEAIDTVSLTANSTWQPFEVMLNSYTGTGSYIAFMSYNTSTYAIYVDDITIDLLPSCPKPSNVTAANSPTDSITVSWTDPTGNLWDVIYGPTGFDPDTSTNVQIEYGVTTNPCIISGLENGTTYDFYVRTDCGNGDISSWSLAPATATPNLFQMGITGNISITSCGVTITDNGGPDGSYSNNCDYTVTIYPTDPTSLVTIYGTVTTEGSDWDYLNIFDGTSTSGERLGHYSTSGTATNFGPFLSSTGPLTLQFHSDASSTYAGFVAYVGCEEASACPRPTNLTLVSTANDEVVLSWSDPNGSMWNVMYGPTGFDPETSTSATIEYGITDTIFAVPDLETGVFYDFYVRSDCGGGEVSNWSFTPVTASPNFFQMGVTGNASITGCNFTITDDGGINGNYSNNCNYTLTIYPSDPDSVVSVSGTFAGEGTADYLNVYEGINTSGTLLEHIVSGSGSSGTVHNFGPLTSESGPLTLKFYSDGSVVYPGFEITVSCVAAPDCRTPYGLTASNISADEATISWTADEDANIELYYKMQSDTEWMVVTSSEFTDVNSYLMTNLTPSSTYHVYVATLCDDDTLETPEISFTTLCVAEIAPYTENFSGFNTNMSPCWSRYSGLASEVFAGGSLTPITSGWYFSSSNVFPLGHPKINIYGTSCKYWLVSPSIDLSGLNDPALMFSLALTDYANANPIEDPTSQADDKFMVIISTDNGNTWSAANATVWDNTGSGDYTYNNISYLGEDIIVSLSDYAGQTIRIAFYGESTATGGDNDLHIANVMVDETPSCPRPTQLTATDATENSITLSWNAGDDETSWEIIYGETGFDIETEGTSIQNVSTNPYTVDNLDASTSYDFYVRATCSSTEQSPWSNVATGRTACDIITTFPFFEGFNSDLGCWISQATIGTVDWTIATSYQSTTLPEGTGYAKAYSTSRGSVSQLISPIMDLSTVENPYLNFYHIQQVWSSDQDSLHVYYRESVSATPVLLASYTNSITSWQAESIAIPSTSATCQIIFEAFMNYGYGVGIDSILVFDNDGSTPVVIEPTVVTNNATNRTQTSATLNGAITNEGNQPIIARGFEWKLTSGGTYTSVSATGTTMSYNLTGLTAETSYTYRAFATTANMTTYGAEITFTTLPDDVEPCNAPTGLTVTNITHNSATISWTAGGTETSWSVQYKSADASQWQETTVQTTTFTMNGLTPQTAYDVRVKAICAPGNESDFINGEFTTNPDAIDNITLANSISLMPNPADNYIDLRINSNVNVKEAVVYNAFGQMVQTVELNDNHARIDLSNMAAGMYFVRVNGDNVSATKKFIKR